MNVLVLQSFVFLAVLCFATAIYRGADQAAPAAAVPVAANLGAVDNFIHALKPPQPQLQPETARRLTRVIESVMHFGNTVQTKGPTFAFDDLKVVVYDLMSAVLNPLIEELAKKALTYFNIGGGATYPQQLIYYTK